jgi:hypothetical protein
LRRNSATTQKSWMTRPERLDSVREDAMSRRPGITHGSQSPLELVSVLRPRRQPAWGRLTMAIYVTAKQVVLGDGHDRAARREQAWYPF